MNVLYAALPSEVRTVFVLRDPRDVLVSMTHYLTYRLRDHGASPHLRHLRNDSERYMAMITGFANWSPFRKRLQGFLGWCRHPDVLTVRFEDLVGPLGGGTEVSQLTAVKSLAAHLNVSLDDKACRSMASQVWSRSSPTFRKGLIGDGRSELSPEVLAALEGEAGDAMTEFGYPPRP